MHTRKQPAGIKPGRRLLKPEITLEPHPPSLQSPLWLTVILAVWMTVVLLAYMLLFSPPIYWEAAGLMGDDRVLQERRNQLSDYFSTVDYSTYTETYIFH